MGRRRVSSGWQPSGVVTLLSDFGLVDAYAGIMKGVVLGAAPHAQTVDLTHNVPPQAVEIGALLLRSAVPYFPPGTVHLAVVDPGVGSDRHPIVAIAEKGILVGPDNGLLHASASALGLIEVRRVAPDDSLPTAVGSTFQGRDVFAPIAGQLAAGRAPQTVGPLVPAMQQLKALEPRSEGRQTIGDVLYVDHFGNLITNIRMAGLAGAGLCIEIGGRSLTRVYASYADVPVGEILAVSGSWGMLEIAQNSGNASRTLRVGRGDPIVVTREN